MQIIERINDDELQLAVSGKLDTNTAPQLEAYINSKFFKVPVAIMHRLVLDLSGVSYISSAGVRVIVAAYKAASVSGSKNLKFFIKNPSDFCKQVFETIGISDYLTFIK